MRVNMELKALLLKNPSTFHAVVTWFIIVIFLSFFFWILFHLHPHPSFPSLEKHTFISLLFPHLTLDTYFIILYYSVYHNVENKHTIPHSHRHHSLSLPLYLRPPPHIYSPTMLCRWARQMCLSMHTLAAVTTRWFANVHYNQWLAWMNQHRETISIDTHAKNGSINMSSTELIGFPILKKNVIKAWIIYNELSVTHRTNDAICL